MKGEGGRERQRKRAKSVALLGNQISVKMSF